MSKERTNFAYLLKHVENDWKDQLFRHTQSLFKESDVPSHNEWHHLRVWKYASEILELIHKKGIGISELEILELMIAIFFHDTGLSISPKADHGKYSRKLCEKFLVRENIQTPINSSEILNAIEYHDDKTYARNNPLIKNQKLNISGILNIADDLDAFGIIGVYRYAEIYLLRGIEPENLATKVIPNLKTRFHHLKYQCFEFQDVITIHTERYQKTLDFFEELNKEFQNENLDDHNKIKIIHLIQKMTISSKYKLKEIIEIALRKAQSEEERLFFDKLTEENSL